MDFLDSSQLEYNSSKEWNSSRQSIILNKECEEKGNFKKKKDEYEEIKKRRDPGSNQGPYDLQSHTLPTELSWRTIFQTLFDHSSGPHIILISL